MSPTTVTVRLAEASEFSEVGRVTVAAYRASGMLREGSPYEAQLADAASRARDAELMVALIDDRVCGTVTFCRHLSRYAEIAQPGEAEFRMLAVVPGSWRAGVGAALVNAVVARARKIGVRAVVLSAPADAHAARRLYAGLGFTRVPARDWHPVPGVSLMAYRRDI